MYPIYNHRLTKNRHCIHGGIPISRITEPPPVISTTDEHARRMAVHEIILSLGMTGGSLIGGYLSDLFGRYVPYWFGIAVLAVSALAQLIIWFTLRADSGRTSRKLFPF